MLKKAPGWVKDTLRRLSTDFPYTEDSATHAMVCNTLSRFYFISKIPDTALAYAQEVQPYFESHTDFLRPLLDCYKIIGATMMDLRMDIFKANYYCSKAAAISLLPEMDTILTISDLSAILSNASATNQVCQLNEQSLRFAKASYLLAEKEVKEKPLDYEGSLQRYFMSLLASGQYDTAKTYFDIEEKMRAVNPDEELDNTWFNCKTNYFYCTKQYDSCLKYVLKTDWAFDPFQGAYTKLELYTILHQPAEAAKNLRVAEQILKDSPDPLPEDELKDFLHHKTRYETLYGNDKETERSFLAYDSLLEDLGNSDRSKMLSSIESEYNLADKQENIDRLSNVNEAAKQKIREKNNLLIVTILGILLFAVTVIVLLLLARQRKLRTEKQLLEARNNKTELEQRLLRTQMEPHFIFNSLSVMQNLIHNHENAKAILYLQQFAGLLRASLENSRENYVPLHDEIEALRNYISLQAMRFEDAFDYSIQLYEGYEQDNIIIPPMLLQPFVENAIYHGIRGVRHKGSIDIHISRQEGSLYCTITDNGPGLQEKAATSRKSLAVRIARERLEIASKETGHTASVSVQNRQGETTGVVVELMIPYKRI